MPHLEVFYTSPDQINTKTGVLKIIEQEAHHFTNVLRHKSGDKIVVVNGCGQAYWVILKVLPKGIVTGIIEKEEQSWGESLVSIGVIIPPLKGQRMDTVIEKGTELGVTWFMIPHTHNTVAKATENKLDRWKRIALAAMKQCGRSVWPSIRIFPNLQATLAECNNIKIAAPTQQNQQQQPSLIILYGDQGGLAMPDILSQGDEKQSVNRQMVFIAVGPEGGFSSDELQLLQSVSATPVNLAPRRLRSDTAIITALSQLITKMQ
jgi:16S rRNA (uracil1498-N3)-methyltransferase